MDKNTINQDYVFCNYIEMSLQTCFLLMLVSSALCFFSVVAFNNKIFHVLSISSSVVMIVWATCLLFNKNWKKPEKKFFSEGLFLAYMSFHFLYFGYALLFNEEKPIIFLFLLITLICVCFFYQQIEMRTMQKRTKSYCKMWELITVPVVIMGYFGAKALFPQLEYEITIITGIALSFLCSLIMGCSCATKFNKAALIRKYHITKP